MTIHTVQCTNCETTLAAREVDDETVPYREACPECGDTDFEFVA